MAARLRRRIPCSFRARRAGCPAMSQTLTRRAGARERLATHLGPGPVPVRVASAEMDPLAQRGFGASLDAARVYERGRPGYAPELAPWLAGELGLSRDSRVLD